MGGNRVPGQFNLDTAPVPRALVLALYRVARELAGVRVTRPRQSAGRGGVTLSTQGCSMTFDDRIGELRSGSTGVFFDQGSAIRQKSGSPGHPQTQGKTERFHQTLQRWLTARPLTADPAQLQQQLETFRAHYNERRPHRALHGRTPTRSTAPPQAIPAANGRHPGHYRLRYDRLDRKGRMTLRRAGRLHHLGAGILHARTRVLALADDHHVTVAELATGDVVSTHLIEPDKSYCRNQNKEPGRWPSSSK